MDEHIYGNTFTSFTDASKPFDPRPGSSWYGWVHPIRNYVNTVEGPVSNIINIHAQIIPTLHVKLFNVDPDENKEIEMKIGETYKVTYVTENGVICHTGKLIEIGNMVVTKNPVPLITGAPTNMDLVSIKLDCSESNQSVIVVVYLRTIRDIEKIVEEPETPPVEESTPTE